jgi:ligand-binding sensor domain-containing protein
VVTPAQKASAALKLATEVIIEKLTFLLITIIVFSCYINAQNTQWINYTNGDGIICLADQDSTMWVGTNGGLVKLDKTTGIPTFFNMANSGLTQNIIRLIAVEDNGTKWIGLSHFYHGGLVEFDGTNWTMYNSSNSGLPGNFVTTIAIDENGTKWIGTDGLAEFDGTNWNTYNNFNSGLPCNNVQSIVIDGNGTKWIGTGHGYYFGTNFRGGLTEFDGNYWTTFNTFNSGMPDDGVQSITIDENGTKWVGTFYGLGVYNEDGIPVYVKENDLTVGCVNISPNPTNDKFNIEFPDNVSILKLGIINIQGRLIKSQRIERNPQTLDVSDFPDGIYVLRFYTENGIATKKLIKQ